MGKTFIIAEAGVNHNGNIATALQLIEAAKRAGADVIKFQTFKAEKLVTIKASKAEYQKRSSKQDENQLDMLKSLELDIDQHRMLIDSCEKRKIIFMSSPFDLDSIDILCDLGLSYIKIPSGEITNVPYLEKIGRLNKKTILSTGMSNIVEIEEALNLLTNSGLDKENITILHCNSEYPTPYEDVNLNAMITIRNTFQVKTGYSDHTLGIEVAVAAVALGASIIEKHFTLDKKMDGPDHKASLEPDELANMIKAIRNIENALGTGIKKPSNSEIKNINLARKSIVAMRHIKSGEIFSEENLTVKRPNFGISAIRWKDILGKQAKKDFQPDDLIEL